MTEPILAEIPLEAIRAYCETQPIRRLSVFGSAARDELTPESDIDLLVEYLPDAPVGLFAMARHRREFGELCGRDVDLCTPNGLSKYIRDEVIESARLIYAKRP
ncbi:MAG: nucleotidyltransferase family protein [Chloroflexi bacterium]|nr:nucleotidyltransferase family protein [Chloroflexota bacterium]